MSEGIPDQPSVLVVGGPLDGHEVRLNQGLTLIVGSGRLANLRLDHPDIELAHIKIIWDDLGISMIDNGSRKGTWVNGEPVETTALLDGDVIEFVAPDAKVQQPRPAKVKLRIPKGSVPEPPPPPPPPPGEPLAPAGAPAAKKMARGPARRRRSALRMPDIDPRLAGLAVGGIGLLVLGGWLAKRMFFTAPSVDAVTPAQVEMGQDVTITGSRFDGDASDNQVWFGSISVAPGTATDHSLHLRVPVLPAAGPVEVSVETRAGRSNRVRLVTLAPLRVTGLDPPGALPGDEVVVSGSGFAEGLTVTVDGQAAEVLKAEATAVRFRMPQVTGAPGSLHPVVVTASGRATPPLQLHLGRLPLVSGYLPAKGVAGDLVKVLGAGFGAGATVRFDGVPALVVAGDAGQLLVVVPPLPRGQPEALVPVVVQAGGRTSADAPGFTVQRLVEGAWVPRFVAGDVGEGGRAGQATVGTELGPVLLLSTKGESRSTAERALSVARTLNAAVDRARVGVAVAFEAREEPEACVALVGAPDRVLRVHPEDAAAYETPPGLPVRGAPPTEIGLARHWAALLTDTVAIGTSGAKPKATADLGPPWTTAFAQLRTALPWQYGSGVSSARVVGAPAELRRQLREAALRAP